MDARHEPLSQEEVDRLVHAAHHILGALQKRGPQFGFNDDAISFLARSINSDRLKADPERIARLTYLYGAFLGHTLLICNPGLDGRWVRAGDEFGVAFDNGIATTTILPIKRVAEQFEHGEARSIHAHFAALCEQLPKARKAVAPARLIPERASERGWSVANDPDGLMLSEAKLRALQPELFSLTRWDAFVRAAWGGVTMMGRIEWRKRLREHLLHGDCCAAMVVDDQLVAAYSDEIDGAVLLRFERTVFEANGWTPGMRLLAVNTYSPIAYGKARDLNFGPQARNQYGDLHALIADLLVDKRAPVESRIAAIPAAEWERLAACAQAAVAAGMPSRNGLPLLAIVSA